MKNLKILSKRKKLEDAAKNNKSLEKALKKNRVIKLNFKQLFDLYFMKHFSRCFEREDQKIWKLYEKGSEKIAKDFDLFNILRALRKTVILTK